MPERRRVSRWQIEKETKVKLGGAEAFADCRITNVNLRGMQLCLKQKLPPDTYLKMYVVFSEEFSAEVEVWVVWHKVVDGHNVYGLYFSKIKDADREKIYKFVHKNCPQEICRGWWKGVEGGEGMPQEKIEDKRVFARLKTKLPVKFLEPYRGLEGEAVTEDVSAKGIGLVTKEQLSLRVPLEMWLKMPGEGEPLYTRGEVAWSKMVRPGEYRAGVNLEKADLMGPIKTLTSA